MEGKTRVLPKGGNAIIPWRRQKPLHVRSSANRGPLILRRADPRGRITCKRRLGCNAKQSCALTCRNQSACGPTSSKERSRNKARPGKRLSRLRRGRLSQPSPFLTQGLHKARSKQRVTPNHRRQG